MTRFIARNENFGGILYDKEKLKHRFLTIEEFGNQSFFPDDVEMWLSDLFTHE